MYGGTVTGKKREGTESGFPDTGSREQAGISGSRGIGDKNSLTHFYYNKTHII